MTTSGVLLKTAHSFKFEILTRFINKGLSRNEAAELLKLSPRSITRLSKSVKSRGIYGVFHGNTGKAPNKKYSDELKQEIINLLCNKYFDFNLKHFHEVLRKELNINVSYQTLWSWCKPLKLIKNPRVKKRRSREYRHRMPSEGLLLQLDGCHHKFNGKDEWCLISAIDDATSNIPYAEFFDGETTLNCMKVLKRIIELKGLPRAIYTDRAGWSAGSKRTDFSQFKRACDKLGIQLIFANSPEGKGRIERSFRTIQDRLIPEFRINKITSIEAANAYLQSTFIKNYWNIEHTVMAESSEIAYAPLTPFIEINNVLCLEETRVVSNDSTVSWRSKRYRVHSERVTYGGYEAIFRTRLDGSLKVFVREAEVKLTEITSELIQTMDAKSKTKIDLSFRHYVSMWRLIGRLSADVRDHQISGKPLKIRKFKNAA